MKRRTSYIWVLKRLHMGIETPIVLNLGIGVSNVVYMGIEGSNVLNMSIMHTNSRTDRRLSYLLSRKDML